MNLIDLFNFFLLNAFDLSDLKLANNVDRNLLHSFKFYGTAYVSPWARIAYHVPPHLHGSLFFRPPKHIIKKKTC